MSTVIDSLVSAINNAIKANGTKAITGNILQVVLDNMVGTLTQINGLLNVNQVNSKSTAYDSASDARQAVPDDLRTEGLVIAYKLSSGWVIEQNKNTTNWNNAFNWRRNNLKLLQQNSFLYDADRIEWISGYYISENGSLAANQSACYAYIDISEIVSAYPYLNLCCELYGIFFASFVDANDSVISTFQADSPYPMGGQAGNWIKYNMQIPSNAKKLGICCFASHIQMVSVLFSKYKNDDVSTKITNIETNMNGLKNAFFKPYNIISEQWIKHNSDFVLGQFLYTNGEPSSMIASMSYCQNYIEIPSGKTKLYATKYGSYMGWFYDSSKTPISEFGVENPNQLSFPDLSVAEINIPANAKYIRFNYYYKFTTLISYYSIISFTPFNLEIEKEVVGISDSLGDSTDVAMSQKGVKNALESVGTSFVKGNCLNKPFTLNSKKFTFFGDSITSGVSSAPVWGQITDCYAKLLTDHYGSTMENLAVSGSKICDTTNDANSICNKIINYSGTTDVIFIAGGTNDYGNATQSPLGTIGDTTYATFYGSLYLICEHLKTYYSDKTIIFITPINRTGAPLTISLNDYRMAIWTMAVKYGFNVIDGSQIGFPTYAERETPLKNLLLADGLHPTDLGHSFMAKTLAGYLS